jgi:hypothetical protein
VDNFWIIGGGKFGLKAAKALRRANSSNNLTIVEWEKAACRRLGILGFEAVCQEGIQYLKQNLIDAQHPDWIIPAIPVHVAYEWIRAKLSANYEMERVSVPNDLITALPNPIMAEAGQLYTSIADFICPESCPEPAEICTYTGKPRLMILHEFLRSIRHEAYCPVIIRSHQLAPGVGGYAPEALFKALKKIEASRLPVLMSTACSCHGVIHTFKHSAKKY